MILASINNGYAYPLFKQRITRKIRCYSPPCKTFTTGMVVSNRHEMKEGSLCIYKGCVERIEGVSLDCFIVKDNVVKPVELTPYVEEVYDVCYTPNADIKQIEQMCLDAANELKVWKGTFLGDKITTIFGSNKKRAVAGRHLYWYMLKLFTNMNYSDIHHNHSSVVITIQRVNEVVYDDFYKNDPDRHTILNLYKKIKCLYI